MKKIITLLLIAIMFGCQPDSQPSKVKVPSNIKLPCVIYFSSDNCGWCKKFDRVWAPVQLESEFENISFYRESELPYFFTSTFQIRGVPALIYINSDSTFTKRVGYKDKNQFRNHLRTLR